MTKGILAMIIPIDTGARPDQSLPGAQPGIDNTLPGGQGGQIDNTLPGDLPIPSHPIYYPLPPGAPVHPDQGLPGDQPYPDQGLPGSQPRPDQGLPGDQPKPSHPIVLPPGGGGGWLPVYIWGPSDPRPGTGLPGDQPGIDNTLPPIPEPPEDAKAQIEWKAMWTPTTGWVSFAVVVPGDAANVPTPSKGQRGRK
jgi:hypothetical protein